VRASGYTRFGLFLRCGFLRYRLLRSRPFDLFEVQDPDSDRGLLQGNTNVGREGVKEEGKEQVKKEGDEEVQIKLMSAGGSQRIG